MLLLFTKTYAPPASPIEDEMRRVALVVLLVLLVMTACQRQEAAPPTATACRTNTAVTLTVLDENNTRLERVQVSYRVNDGDWMVYPERVNGRVTLDGGPGSYQIQAQKPGYQTGETTIPITAFTCGEEAVLTTLVLPYAVCPTDPHPLLIQLPPGHTPQLRARDGNGRERTLACQEQNNDGCLVYAWPLQQGDVGAFSLEIKGLPGVGAMQVVDGVVAYESTPFDLTLRQGNRQQTFDLATSAAGTFSLPVDRDEVGCPLVDLTAVTLTTTAAYPEPTVHLAGNLLMTDLGAAVCQQRPVLSDITYIMELPPGTHLEETQMIYWRDEAWVTGECRLENGHYLCTAQLPNPLINQFYSVRAVVNGQEYIGTQLPFSNMCMVFSE